MVVFNFFIPCMYCFGCLYLQHTILELSYKSFFSVPGNVLQPLLCGLLTFGLTFCVSHFTGTFPIRFCFLYVFGVLVVTSLLFYGRKTHSKSKSSDNSNIRTQQLFKLKMSIAAVVLLLVGWSFAVMFLQVFNAVSPLYQALILCAISVWKALLGYYLKIVCGYAHAKRGITFDVHKIALCVSSVSWFWTVFTNIAFAGVTENSVFGAYFVVELVVALEAVRNSSEHESCLKSEGKWRCSCCYCCCASTAGGLASADGASASASPPGGGGAPTPSPSSLRAARESKHLDAIRTVSVTAFGLFGDLAFSSYALLLFLCCRYGPNGSYTPVSALVFSDAHFRNLVLFMSIIVVRQGIVAMVANRFGMKWRNFDPKENLVRRVKHPKTPQSHHTDTPLAHSLTQPPLALLSLSIQGEFIGKHWIILTSMPLVLHLPMLWFMFPSHYGGMGVVLGN